MSTAPATRIGIAVVESEGRFLIGVRGPESPLAGPHEFPGGKVHADESSEECAIRECLEETGIDVRATELLFHCLHDYAHGRVELHFFLCRPVHDGHPPAIGRFEWRPVSELSGLRFPEANAPVVELLLDRASKSQP